MSDTLTVGSQVTEALKKLEEKRFENAIVPASVALCATAKREFPNECDPSKACHNFLDQSLPIISKIAWVLFGVSCPVNVRYRRLDGRKPEIDCRTMPEMLYDIVRCTAVQEAKCPDNLKFVDEPVIELKPDGGLVLPITVIWGMLIAIVASPKNAGERAEGDPKFSFAGKSIQLNELWGEREKVAAFIGIK